MHNTPHLALVQSNGSHFVIHESKSFTAIENADWNNIHSTTQSSCAPKQRAGKRKWKEETNSLKSIDRKDLGGSMVRFKFVI